LRKTIANIEEGKQLIKASGPVDANYIEANESLSKKDFILRIKICRKEAKESRYWLRLIDTEEALELAKEQKGFTLIELLIAMVIMGIAFVGLANTQISCINSISNSRGLTNAVILAQDKMEELKSLDPGHPGLADTNPNNNGTLRSSIDPHDSDHRENFKDFKEEATQTALNLNRAHYTRLWNVADNTPLPGIKTVVVIVSWKSGRKSIAVSSVI